MLGSQTVLHRRQASAAGCVANGAHRHTVGRVTAPARLLEAAQLVQLAGARASARNMATAAAAQDGQTVTAVSDSGLPRDAIVGVLGGGQLGRMMALAAGNLGVTIKCLDPAEDAPAAVASYHTLGHFRDADAVKEFVRASGAQVVTTEIEHIDADALEAVRRDLGIDCEPSASTVRLIQDKYIQKVHFQGAGVPLGEFTEVSSEAQLQEAGRRFGYPLMLKSRRLAYDGRGNYVVRSEVDLAAGAAALGGVQQGLYAEAWQPFVKELAVMVVRSRDGSVLSYPVVETIHKDNICHVTEAPAAVPEAVAARARATAEAAVQALDGAGIFGVEMFLLPDGSVKLNEVAPRPHNSGHYTQDGCVTSQFENHLRAILGWPLGLPSLNCGSAIMLNILGETEGDEGVRRAHELMRRAYLVPGAKVHWYGKPGMRAGRKVGHINIVAPDRAEGRRRLSMIDPAAAASLAATGHAATPAAAAASTSGSPGAAPQVGIIMGSDSDLPTMKAAAQVLDEFGVPCEVTVVSAHRTPERMMEYAHSAHKRGVKVIIAGAGGAAHLPGMVAAMTPLPVIGVPVKPAGSHLDGVDALLSICQMPRGVPVATVAIGNATNAGLLAVRILGGSDPALLQKMLDYQQGMKDTVLGKAQKLEQQGWRGYEVNH